MVIVRGQNVFLHDIEQVAESALDGVVPNSVAAFIVPSAEAQEGEQFAIVAGLPRSRQLAENAEELVLKIRNTIAETLQLAPNAVAIVPAWEIPKTSSGKIRRSMCTSMWSKGAFTIFAELDGRSAAQEGVYHQLQERLKKLDARNTNYQFDLERDIDWSRVTEPGRYFSDEFLAQAPIDLVALKAHPEALAFSNGPWPY